MNGNFYSACRTGDLDLGNTRAVEFLLQELSDLVIFVQIICKIAFRIPSGFPVIDNADSKSMRIYFLSHVFPPYFSFSTMVIWLILFSIR